MCTCESIIEGWRHVRAAHAPCADTRRRRRGEHPPEKPKTKHNLSGWGGHRELASKNGSEAAKSEPEQNCVRRDHGGAHSTVREASSLCFCLLRLYLCGEVRLLIRVVFGVCGVCVISCLRVYGEGRWGVTYASPTVLTRLFVITLHDTPDSGLDLYI